VSIKDFDSIMPELSTNKFNENIKVSTYDIHIQIRSV